MAILTRNLMSKLEQFCSFLVLIQNKRNKQNPAQDLNLLCDVPTSHIENAESETRWFSSVQKQSQFTGPSSPSVS